MMVTAHCHRCDWTAAGSWLDVDKAAEAHTRKAGHSTATIAIPSKTTKRVAI